MRTSPDSPCTSNATSTSVTCAASSRTSESRSRLPQRDPSVHRDPLAGDVARGIAREERRELTDVLGRLLAPEGHAALHDLEKDVARLEVRVLGRAALDRRRQSVPRARPQKARADRVHPNVVLRPVEREALRQCDYAG